MNIQYLDLEGKVFQFEVSWAHHQKSKVGRASLHNLAPLNELGVLD